MVDFDFINSTSNLTFDFGLTGDFSNFTFTEISTGDSSYDFDFGAVSNITRILFGSNNNFNSIWADPTASLTNGRFYVGRPEDLHTLSRNGEQVSVENYFSKTVAGSTNDTLDSDDSVDINVVG
jgi:hypothetical protein